FHGQYVSNRRLEFRVGGRGLRMSLAFFQFRDEFVLGRFVAAVFRGKLLVGGTALLLAPRVAGNTALGLSPRPPQTGHSSSPPLASATVTADSIVFIGFQSF